MYRAFAVVLFALFALGGLAQPGPAQAADRTLVLEAGSGKVIRTGRPIANLFAADPKVAEVRPASTSSVFVFGVGAGRTTVAAFDDAGDLIVQYDVVVRPSGYVSGESQRMTADALPRAGDVQYETTPSGVTVTGRVGTPGEAERAVAIGHDLLGPKGGDVDNRLAVNSSLQVSLHVRIAEISRQVTRELGINWSAIGNIGRVGVFGNLANSVGISGTTANTLGITSIGGRPADAILDLLAEDNLITVLAEPNLIARSGEQAAFLAGGEFPVPTAQENGGISVQFQSYGVSLTFVPTVISPDRISINVAPEVSQLTTTGSVSVPLVGSQTVTIPGLTVRRAQTTVELGSGQTLAIAGLLQSNINTTSSGLPYLGELPVIAPLFKSDSFQRSEDELVILVTPYLVRPVNVASSMHSPTDGMYPPANDFERAVLMRQRALPAGAGEGKPAGDAGFLLN